MPPKRVIALTMGDPAGIGPELALQAVRHFQRESGFVIAVFGDQLTLERVASTARIPCDLSAVPLRSWLDDATCVEQSVIVQASEVDLSQVTAGHVNSKTGEASFRFVEMAIDAAMQRRVDAVVTCPIHKEAWSQAGIDYPGHTELFADRCSADTSCMMLTSDEITCSLVTTHIGLSEVARSITTQGVYDTIRLTANAIESMRGRPGRLVVCGLNPHAGEHGLFGQKEEERIIQPAVDRAHQEGLDVVGPIPADTAFVPAMRRETDAYICMYHDQGLAVLKALAFDRAVNTTLGLPIVRTSVDHGTALDLAWRGVADRSSLDHAIRLAVQLAASDRSRPIGAS